MEYTLEMLWLLVGAMITFGADGDAIHIINGYWSKVTRGKKKKRKKKEIKSSSN